MQVDSNDLHFIIHGNSNAFAKPFQNRAKVLQHTHK